MLLRSPWFCVGSRYVNMFHHIKKLSRTIQESDGREILIEKRLKVRPRPDNPSQNKLIFKSNFVFAQKMTNAWPTLTNFHSLKILQEKYACCCWYPLGTFRGWLFGGLVFFGNLFGFILIDLTGFISLFCTVWINIFTLGIFWACKHFGT